MKLKRPFFFLQLIHYDKSELIFFCVVANSTMLDTILDIIQSCNSLLWAHFMSLHMSQIWIQIRFMAHKKRNDETSTV